MLRGEIMRSLKSPLNWAVLNRVEIWATFLQYAQKNSTIPSINGAAIHVPCRDVKGLTYGDTFMHACNAWRPWVRYVTLTLR